MSRLVAVAWVFGLAACHALEPRAELISDPGELYFFVLPTSGIEVQDLRLANMGPDALEVTSVELPQGAGDRLAVSYPGTPFLLEPGGVFDVQVGVIDLTNLGEDGLDATVDVQVFYDAVRDDHRTLGAPLVVPVRIDVPTDCDNDEDGYVAEFCGGDDCDDVDPLTNPSVQEVCDGHDNDCDGEVDNNAINARLWFEDLDADGYGDPNRPEFACEQPIGFVRDGSDCDDTEPSVNPSADEICNERDDDCNGVIDDDALDELAWYPDQDGDTFGSDRAEALVACTAPKGYELNRRDCDDYDASINPLADEICDGEDNDCDGLIDEDSSTSQTWYADLDSDGYGDSGATTTACEQPSGFVDVGGDCDDSNPRVNPAAEEVCDNVDNDCDGTVDGPDASGSAAYYADADGDGYGNASSTVTACTAPSGYVSDRTDCDDTRAAINPGATEVCDSLDNDCDSAIDDADSSLDTSTATDWYTDGDGDSFGAGTAVDTACTAPSGTVSDDTDCDDTDASIYPGADEVCDGEDQDCDGVADNDAIDADTWYADADGDDYGDDATTTVSCEQPRGYVDVDGDCDDTDADINPDATDSCNGIDDDCSGYADDGGTCPCDVAWDADGDAYMFCQYNLSWRWSNYVCTAFDYELVTIDDATEDAWLDTTADAYSTDEWFIGLNDRASEGTFVWEDGTTVSYTNWATGEPNDSGGEDCAELNWYTDGTWNDISCGDNLYFICEAP